MLMSVGLRIFLQILDTAVEVVKDSVKGDKLSTSVVVKMVRIQAVTLGLFSWREMR
jgi:hypothetical protein